MGKDNQDDIFDILSREGALEEALVQPEKPAEEKADSAEVKSEGWIRAKELGIPYIRISPDQIDPDLVRILPEDLERKNLLVPYLRIGNDLTVIMADPENAEVIQDVKKISGCEVEAALGEREEILSALDLAYGRVEMIAPPSEKEAAPPISSECFDQSEVQKIQGDPSGEVLLDLLLQKATERDATRVFIRHLETETLISLRIRRGLAILGHIDRAWGTTLETRISILSATLHKEGSPSSSGSFYRQVGGKDLLVSASIYSLARGREIVLRIIDPGRPALELGEFNLDPKDLKLLEETVSRREGLLLVCGSREEIVEEAAYALLGRTDPRKHRVVTVEHRSGRIIPDYTQISTAATGDRSQEDIIESLVELDPDIAYLSDLVDPESQWAAFRLATGGSLVIGGVPFARVEQGLAFLSSLPEGEDLLPVILQGILSVDQLKMLCSECRQPDPESARGGKGSAKAPQYYLPRGCPRCGHTGYRGWNYVSEFIPASPLLADTMRKGASESQWEKFLGRKGHRKLAWIIEKELKAGTITREEAALHGVSGSTAKG